VFEKFQKLETLGLFDTNVGNKGLERIARLPNLNWLEIGDTKVTSAAAATLGTMTKLERLSLQGLSFKDADLKPLVGLKRLRELSLDGNRVTGAGLLHLGQMKSLRDLHLWTKGKVAESDLDHLSGLRLKKLWLNRFDNPSPKLFARLIACHGPEAEDIDFQGHSLGDAELKRLAAFPKLKKLTISGPFTDDGLRAVGGLTELQRLAVGTAPTDDNLSMPTTGRFTDAGLKHVVALNHLTELELFGGQLTDAGIAKCLRAMPKLTRVVLMTDGVGVETIRAINTLGGLQLLGFNTRSLTDPVFAHLRAANSLRTLWLFNTSMTDAGLAHLKGLRLNKLYCDGTFKTPVGTGHLIEALDAEETYLSLDKWPVTDAHLKRLTRFKCLKSLDLQNATITAAGLKRLTKLKTLRWLTIPAGLLTKAELKAFQKAHPDLHVSEG
jgi:internalin A